jgi:electron transport complex protein RnfD
MSEETKNQNEPKAADTETAQVKLPDPEKLLISSSPHLHGKGDVTKIMALVLLALTPSCLMGIYHYGFAAVKVLFVCSAGCVGFEYLVGRMVGRPNAWKDCSALLTGLLLGMCLSAGTPWWVCLVGCFLAIVLAKQMYGGLGYNPFNPALVARIGLIIGFPKILTTWVPSRMMDKSQFMFNNEILSADQIAAVKNQTVLPFFHSVIEGVTCATPLNEIKEARKLGTASQQMFNQLTDGQSLWDFAIGNMGGCIGETSAIALLIGGLFLIWLKLIKWQIPVAYIGTVAVFSAIAHACWGNPAIPGALFQVLTGGLLLGAFFMATDMVTSPMTNLGSIIFGVGCGIITCVIRDWGAYPEGVMFSIVIMNSLTPLIDRYTSKKPFGFVPPEPKKQDA